MKLIYYLTLLPLLTVTSCDKDRLNNMDYSEPTGRRLRVIMEEKFPNHNMLVGVTAGLWAFDYACGTIIDKEFNYITPENDFKQKIIHPNNTDWNFTNGDTWVAHAQYNGQIVRMHCPIGPQASNWAKDDSRTSEDLTQNMTDFLTQLCKHYANNNQVSYMDVVNETVKNGSWFESESGVQDWENPWTRIGYDTDKNKTPLYIKMAFEITNQNAPTIKQLFNHHESPDHIASWQLIKETIMYLRSLGLRVDAIGWQAHVTNGWATEDNLNALRELIDWAQANKLEFHVTEASSFIVNQPSTYELELQADTYSKIVSVLLEKCNNGIIGWNTWHLTDAYTYKSEYYPSLFDKNCNPKPAYYAIQKKLEDYN